MSKKSSDKKIKVANTEIIIGQTYEVTPKKDKDAPSGFQQYGTTKLLMKGIKEVHSIPYDETRRLRDVGFDINDDINRDLPPSEKEAIIESYKKAIKEPYEKSFRADLDNTNEDFYETYTYDIYTGKSYDTNDPKDLFDLYNALRQGDICEPSEKNARLQRSARYNIKNIQKVQSVEEEKAETKFEAIAKFQTLLEGFTTKDDKDLYSILEWINMPNIRGADKETVRKTGIKLFNNEKIGFDNARRFLEAYEMTQDESEKEVMDIYTMLQKLNNKRKLEYKRRQYYLDETLLGNHLKEAAKKAFVDPELKEVITTEYAKIKRNE